MNERPEVMILSAVRTGIGKYGGGLATVPPCDLDRSGVGSLEACEQVQERGLPGSRAALEGDHEAAQ